MPIPTTAIPPRGRRHPCLHQDAAELAVVEQDVIGPLEAGGRKAGTPDRAHRPDTGGDPEASRRHGHRVQTKAEGQAQPGPPRHRPRSALASPAGTLMLGQAQVAVDRLFAGPVQEHLVGRGNLDMTVETTVPGARLRVQLVADALGSRRSNPGASRGESWPVPASGSPSICQRVSRSAMTAVDTESRCARSGIGDAGPCPSSRNSAFGMSWSSPISHLPRICGNCEIGATKSPARPPVPAPDRAPRDAVDWCTTRSKSPRRALLRAARHAPPQRGYGRP